MRYRVKEFDAEDVHHLSAFFVRTIDTWELQAARLRRQGSKTARALAANYDTAIELLKNTYRVEELTNFSSMEQDANK